MLQTEGNHRIPLDPGMQRGGPGNFEQLLCFLCIHLQTESKLKYCVAGRISLTRKDSMTVRAFYISPF